MILILGTCLYLTIDVIRVLADIVNGLTVILDLIALVGLRKVIVSGTQRFFGSQEIIQADIRSSNA